MVFTNNDMIDNVMVLKLVLRTKKRSNNVKGPIVLFVGTGKDGYWKFGNYDMISKLF